VIVRRAFASDISLKDKMIETIKSNRKLRKTEKNTTGKKVRRKENI